MPATVALSTQVSSGENSFSFRSVAIGSSGMSATKRRHKDSSKSASEACGTVCSSKLMNLA
jgi:hypothetical protein